MSNPTHALKLDARALRTEHGIGYQDAVKILSEPDTARRADLLAAVTEHGCNTYKAVAQWYERLRPDQRTLCTVCGWTVGMVCPECSRGCGCSAGCTGWRHREYVEASDDFDGEADWGCPDCGCGDGTNYGPECQCNPDVCDECGHDNNDPGCVYNCECAAC
ncbi:hypothetical protein [Streptomyces sp. XY511]|uniref:hypothetical protein n=1 Tax=Streptomyces sp. XY511 TaxID=1519480 RepID=UPI0006AE6B9B|nr:hypothetical protein [Streptomyces sp. XY511]